MPTVSYKSPHKCPKLSEILPELPALLFSVLEKTK